MAQPLYGQDLVMEFAEYCFVFDSSLSEGIIGLADMSANVNLQPNQHFFYGEDGLIKPTLMRNNRNAIEVSDMYYQSRLSASSGGLYFNPCFYLNDKESPTQENNLHVIAREGKDLFMSYKFDSFKYSTVYNTGSPQFLGSDFDPINSLLSDCFFGQLFISYTDGKANYRLCLANETCIPEVKGEFWVLLYVFFDVPTVVDSSYRLVSKKERFSITEPGKEFINRQSVNITHKVTISETKSTSMTVTSTESSTSSFKKTAVYVSEASTMLKYTTQKKVCIPGSRSRPPSSNCRLVDDVNGPKTTVPITVQRMVEPPKDIVSTMSKSSSATTLKTSTVEEEYSFTMLPYTNITLTRIARQTYEVWAIDYRYQTSTTITPYYNETLIIATASTGGYKWM